MAGVAFEVLLDTGVLIEALPLGKTNSSILNTSTTLS